MVKGVTVIEAWMDEGSGYCGCGSEIESVSDAAKNANMVMTGAGEGWNLFGERHCRVKYETKIFGRQAGSYGVGGREGERGVDYFRGLLRETDRKEFSFGGIERKIIRRHPRWDESDSEMKVVYGRRYIFRNKGYEELRKQQAYRRWEIEDALTRELRGMV